MDLGRRWPVTHVSSDHKTIGCDRDGCTREFAMASRHGRSPSIALLNHTADDYGYIIAAAGIQRVLQKIFAHLF